MRNRPALAISVLALFVALGGTGYAAFSLPRNSVGAKQLKRNAVTTPKIKNGAVTTGKIKNGAVTGPKMNFRGVIVPQAALASSASTANSATHAANADLATNATNATSATNAANATNATNATQLGGTAAASYVQYGSTLPSGRTESGDWGSGFTSPGASSGWSIVATFRIPLSAALDAAHVVYVSGSSASNCPGAGQAARGYLCLYQGFVDNAATPNSSNIFNPESAALANGASQQGFGITMTASGAGFALVTGSYAVTAP